VMRRARLGESIADSKVRWTNIPPARALSRRDRCLALIRLERPACRRPSIFATASSTACVTQGVGKGSGPAVAIDCVRRARRM